jgi:hypothetical protein
MHEQNSPATSGQANHVGIANLDIARVDRETGREERLTALIIAEK